MLHIVQKNRQELEAKKFNVAGCNQLIRYFTEATYFQKILSDKYNRTEHYYYPWENSKCMAELGVLCSFEDLYF